MKIQKRYYRVRFRSNFVGHEVRSLAEVKKLIKNTTDWVVDFFVSDGTISGVRCVSCTWYEHYEACRKSKWEPTPCSFDKLAFAIYKSRIAK